MIKKCAVLMALILTLALLCGCSDGKEAGPEWLGEWKTDDITLAQDLFDEGVTAKGSILLTLSADQNHDPDKMGNYTVEADVSYKDDSNKGTVNGQYAVENGTLYIGESVASVNGDTLTMQVGEKVIVFQKQ